MAAGLFLAWSFLTIVPNAFAAASASPSTAEECLACHNDPDLKKAIGGGRYISLEATPMVEEFSLAQRRAGMFFESFHETHKIQPSSDPRSSVGELKVRGSDG